MFLISSTNFCFLLNQCSSPPAFAALPTPWPTPSQCCSPWSCVPPRCSQTQRVAPNPWRWQYYWGSTSSTAHFGPFGRARFVSSGIAFFFFSSFLFYTLGNEKKKRCVFSDPFVVAVTGAVLQAQNNAHVRSNILCVVKSKKPCQLQIKKEEF